MTTQHTPGPWGFDDKGGNPDKWRVFANGHVILWIDSNYPNQNANARLIASAPDMLEALKWIASLDLSGADDRAIALMAYAIVSKARFAVLEATGERV